MSFSLDAAAHKAQSAARSLTLAKIPYRENTVQAS